MYYGESVDCNVIMQPVIQCYLLSCRFSRTSKLWSCIRGYVDLWIILRMKINIMKKKLDLISVVLRCYCVLCIGQVTFKGGRKLVLATCCQEFTIEEFLAQQLHTDPRPFREANSLINQCERCSINRKPDYSESVALAGIVVTPFRQDPRSQQVRVLVYLLPLQRHTNYFNNEIICLQ